MAQKKRSNHTQNASSGICRSTQILLDYVIKLHYGVLWRTTAKKFVGLLLDF